MTQISKQYLESEIDRISYELIEYMVKYGYAQIEGIFIREIEPGDINRIYFEDYVIVILYNVEKYKYCKVTPSFSNETWTLWDIFDGYLTTLNSMIKYIENEGPTAEIKPVEINPSNQTNCNGLTREEVEGITIGIIQSKSEILKDQNILSRYNFRKDAWYKDIYEVSYEVYFEDRSQGIITYSYDFNTGVIDEDYIDLDPKDWK